MQTQNAGQESHTVMIPIQHYELDNLFAHFFRFPPFFDEARELISADHFHAVHEAAYLYLWMAAVQLRERGRRFTTLTLSNETRELIDASANFIEDSQIDEVLRQDGNGIIWSATKVQDDELDLPFCRETLQKFLRERVVVSGIRRLPLSADGSYASNVGQELSYLADFHRRLDGLGTLPTVAAAPVLGSIIEPQPLTRSCGVDFVDEAVGQRQDGSVVGFLGVTGGGKTTFAAQLAVASAKQAVKEALLASRDPEKSLFFCYEEPPKRVQPKIWSSAFGIARETLESLTDWSVLSTRGALKDYERAMNAGKPTDQILSEKDRWLAGADNLNKSLVLFDMSGTSDTGCAGTGGVVEIEAMCERILADGGVIRDMIIDWAGLLCERWLSIHGGREDNLRKTLTSLGSSLHQLAVRYHCCIYVMHQLRADAGGLSSTKFFHHSDAAESKAFAERMDVCGCLGVPHVRTGARTLNWSKVRNRPPSDAMRQIVKINPVIAKFEAAELVIDGNDFVLPSLANQVQGGSAATQRTQPTQQPSVVADAGPTGAWGERSENA